VRNLRAAVPARLRRAVWRGLRASAAERYGSMDALIAALEQARRPAVALPLAALGAAAAIAAAFFLRSSPPPLEPDEQVRSLLAQMDKETDAVRLSEMDGRLGQLIVHAQRSRDELRKRGGAAPLPPSDELDADIRSLLRKFGAETYLVPPIFKERVRSHLARLLKNPQLAVIYQRKQQYWPMLARELETVGLPEEMGYVVWIESHFDPAARSPMGSFGLWQLSPPVARSYGLRVDAEVDERGDPAKDTRAAARCFADLLAQFGADSFMLALASYNSGEQRVQRALQRVAQEPGGFSRDKRDFWHLYRRKLLSQETSEYVPSVLAAAIVGSHPQRYGLAPGR
jgi:hypothetical protein